MSALRIGLVGLDHWYSALPLAEGAARGPGTELAAVWDADPARAAGVAKRFGVPRVEEDWRRLVTSPDIDAVLSLVSPDLNPAVCRAAAAAGKHLLGTKPLARTLEDADAVVAAVREAGVVYLPAESRQRLGPRMAFLRRWVDDGRLGPLVTATMTTWAGLPRRRPDDPEPGWFADPARTVGGGWVDHAIYQIDALRWLLGEEIVSIGGHIGRTLHPDLAVEDAGVATALFAGGAVATLENTWTAPDGGFQASQVLAGGKGALRMDGLLDRLLVLSDLPELPGWVEPAMPAAHDQAADIGHWAASIRGEVPPVASVLDAWHNLAACLAFYEAARTGRATAPRVAPR